MSDIQDREIEEPVTEKVEDEATAEQQAETPEEPDPEREAVEETARHFGWKPKDQFHRGPPENWVDADRYLQMPNVQARMFKESSEKFEKENQALRDQLGRLEGVSKLALDRVREQERQSYEAKIANIEAQKAQAVEIADVEAYQRLSKQQQEIQAPQPVVAPQNAPPPEVVAYAETPEGAWTKNEDARVYGSRLIDASPEARMLPPMKQVKWAEKRVKEQWPELFPADPPPPQTSAKVDGGGLATTRRVQSADQLPPEARRAGEEYVAEGVFNNLNDYAKAYFAQGSNR